MADLAPGVVTLFGGSGFIGSQAVRALARRGWRIRVAVRNPVLAIEIQPLGDPGQIQFMRCDITNPADVAQAVRGADAVVNLVGVLHDAGGKRGFDAVHTEAARTIAEAAKAAGVERLVQISAIGADAASPSAYGRTKAQAEAAVRAVYPDAVLLRPSLVFGAGDSFLNRFAAMATMAPALPLIGGGETRFQPVYVGDVAEAIARGVTRADAVGRTYELGGPSLYTFREVLELVRRETGRDRMLVSVPFIVAKPLGSLLQLSRFVGLTPPLTRDQVLMLEKDNVVAADAFGLSDLGIDHPAGMAAIAPSYLWRYRVGGQFAEAPAH
ncbi:complex I NDUFA9 subunit family protein [uncultured Brevundimonas sp.]|uniref:complex I NDUFA9 subunit family protein n=1 Tax=uncultured Brevundimonas sp. TaxID=213418 RepID=UPI0025F4402F|nr:complex I NDUFA9 subunit family protein [uncultured Brevundimonas sp.]